MTLRDFIVRLQEIEKIKGGDIPVYFNEEGRYPALLDIDDVVFKLEENFDIGDLYTEHYPNRIEIG